MELCHHTFTTADALKNGLNGGGPLVTTMEVYDDFYYYMTGSTRILPDVTWVAMRCCSLGMMNRASIS